MRYLLLTFFFSISFAFLGGTAAAQIDERCPHINVVDPRTGRMMRSKSVREQLIKLCIKENKEDFDELIARTEELARLTEELKELEGKFVKCDSARLTFQFLEERFQRSSR